MVDLKADWAYNDALTILLLSATAFMLPSVLRRGYIIAPCTFRASNLFCQGTFFFSLILMASNMSGPWPTVIAIES